MKKIIYYLTLVFLLLQSCKKQKVEKKSDEISADVLTKINKLGYSNKDVKKIDSGYIVEGDIFVHQRDLDKKIDWFTIRIANTEQYRTNTVITGGLPRVLKVWVSGELSQVYKDAADIAIARFNALGLQLTFQRTSNVFSTNIHIWNWDNPIDDVWAASGTPGNNTQPYPLILMNVGEIGPSPNVNFLATVIAHEMGHCIGFRHTDYMDRSYSCFTGGDEGQGSSGAVHIAGTPTGPDADSWMLACIGGGVNRPFTANDIIALQAVY